MSIDRRRASMVLFDLEKALGSLVCQLFNDNAAVGLAIRNKIIARELARTGASLEGSKLEKIVQAAYLEELLQMAVQGAKGTEYELAANRLNTLCTALDIFEVRNACAHPLRDFPRQFWFKVAVIASDHSLVQLGLSSPIASLAAAEADTLAEPPPEWIEKLSWELPNNLPERLDHEITGLIGRRKIQRKLIESLHNQRNSAITVVARGGVGKTALVLEVLRNIVVDPSEAERFDLVAYVSIKDEFLTKHGVKRIGAAKSKEEVEAAIVGAVADITGESYADFPTLVKSSANDRILLCLDNLESVLRDQPDFFQMLNSVIPIKWRLLMTSRVRVDGALSIPIDDLEAPDAEALAHRYGRILALPLRDDMAKEVARLSRNNPLALKLTMDFMATGRDLYSAAETASSEIVQFAYDKLIEALSDNAVKMLEVVFVNDGCARSDFVGALGIDSDSVAEGVSELTNTSLVTRELGDVEERFYLNESVRDFMRVNPRNLRLRAEIEAGIRRSREVQRSALAEQERRGVNSHSVEYVPAALPDHLADLAFKVNRLFRKGAKRSEAKQIGALIDKFRACEAEFDGYEAYWRFFGRLMSRVDTAGAISLLNRAREVDETKPQSRALQGWLYLKIGRASDAAAIFTELESEGWGSEERAGERFGSYVRLGYLRSLVYSEFFDRVIEETVSWKAAGRSSAHEGLARVSALRQREADGETKGAAFEECLEIIDRLATEIGYTKELCSQAIKLYKDVGHWMQYRELDSGIASMAVESMARHLQGMSALISRGDLIALDLDGLAESQQVSEELANRIRSVQQGTLGVPILHPAALTKDGYRSVEVSAPPRETSSGVQKFLFAKDESGQDYYVNINSLQNGGWSEWSKIQRGEQLFIKVSTKQKGGKAPSSTQTLLMTKKVGF